MSGGTFGRKGSVDGAALAARRAAFLAEERARASRPDLVGARSAAAANQAFAPEKSVGVAYLLWFFLGGVSAHRFYLGYTVSAVIQLALGPFCWTLLLTGSLWALLPLMAAGLWILADAFLIPSMARDANQRGRRADVAGVFA